MDSGELNSMRWIIYRPLYLLCNKRKECLNDPYWIIGYSYAII